MGERARELITLIVGDLLLFSLALWLTLLVRYLAFPSSELFAEHFGPFLIISAVWLLVFYIAGLYDKQTVFYKSLLISRIINTLLVNGLIAALLFLIIPFGIAPKTNLVIYIFINIILFSWWRVFLYPKVSPKTLHRALLLADGPEALELVKEVNNNSRYNYSFVRVVDKKTAAAVPDFPSKLLDLIERERIDIIVANASDSFTAPVLPKLFALSLLKFKLTLLDFYKVYEETFDRVPLTALDYNWFISNVSQSKKVIYDFLKRVIDIVGSIILGIILLLILPFIYLVIRLEGKGDLFIVQERLGQYGQRVLVYKIRTMTENRSSSATWTVEDKKEGNKITRVGAILRKLSLDELPQVLNILKGEMSLIGPRNDIKGLGERSAEAIPYYNIRNFVKPGVTGWAQTHQYYQLGNISPQSMEETKTRLSYDLFYVKNRSLMLDLDIALRTFKTLLSRFGIVIRLRRPSVILEENKQND